MKRREVRVFIRDGVNALAPAPTFSEGLITDFNSMVNQKMPTVHHLLEENETEIEENQAPLDSWSIRLVIGNIDAMDSKPEQYEDIVDACDEIAQKLIYKYRNVISGYKNVTMDGIRREKFVKKHASCLTGIELSFKLIATDRTNVC